MVVLIANPLFKLVRLSDGQDETARDDYETERDVAVGPALAGEAPAVSGRQAIGSG